jgi:3-phenylpropionate/trans-cinnamate dioxygenase ferredoxin subunit
MSERADPGEFHWAANLADLAPGAVRTVEIEGCSILLCRSGERIFAVENQCSHAQQPLEGGRVKAGWIACPTHGARFDLETGEPLCPPATEPIRTFPVRIEGEAVLVAL